MNLRIIPTLVSLVVSLALTVTLDAATLTDAQRAHIDRYLVSQALNEYGDAKGTLYLGGTPLFDEATGLRTDRYEYLLRKFPRILEGFVSTLPHVGVEGELASRSIGNDCDPSRLPDRFMDEVLRAEEEAQQLIETVRAAIDAHDFKAVSAVLAQLAGLPVQQLVGFGAVLKDVRRMLNGVCLQELELTQLVQALLAEVDGLERRVEGR